MSKFTTEQLFAQINYKTDTCDISTYLTVRNYDMKVVVLRLEFFTTKHLEFSFQVYDANNDLLLCESLEDNATVFERLNNFLKSEYALD